MPIQWLGTLPVEDPYAPLAEAIRTGTEAFVTTREKRRERELELGKLSFQRKKELANLLIETAKALPPAAAKELLSHPQSQVTLADVGMAVPYGLGARPKDVGKVAAMLTAKEVPSLTGFPIPIRKREEAEKRVMLELGDVNWRENYPEVAELLDKQFPPPEVKVKKKVEKQPKLNYRAMSEDELYPKVKAGDTQARREAVRRGLLRR